MTRSNTRLCVLLGLMWIPVALNAQADRGSGADQTYCRPVSSEEVVAATSDQGATLDTADCTERFRLHVSEILGQVRKSYSLLFEDLPADPKMIDALTWLIVRDQLLSSGWISLRPTSVSHDQSAANSMLLRETNTRLRELLTQEDFALFQKFKKSLPTRELLEPVISRLHSAGMPPSKAQLERAVEDVQSWAAGLVERAHDDAGGEEVLYCEQANALKNRRESQLLAILSESLDEQQASVVRTYYRERTEQREQELADYRAKAGNAPCMINSFN